MRTLDHVHWETRTPRSRRAIDLGCGAGNDSLELLRQGWKVLAIDRQAEALRMLSKRVPARLRGSLTMLVAPMEGLSLPPADLINASFSLPFCAPDRFEELWAGIRTSLRPGGHFAGQLFGTRDEWHGHRPLTFHSGLAVRRLARGYRTELFRETEEDGRSFEGPKRWHYFEVILEKSRRR